MKSSFPHITAVGGLALAVHDPGKKVLTVKSMSLLSKLGLCKTLEVCLPAIISLGRQMISVSVQAKRLHLRHSEMPKDKNYMFKVVEP